MTIIELTAIFLIQAILIFIGRNWIIHKISNNIKFGYDKSLENYKNELLVKQKSELISELISEWISKPTEQKKLNNLCFQAFLWLPKSIAEDLSNLLSHKPESKDVRHIIAIVRIHLLGEKEQISPEEIIIFTQELRNLKK